MKTLLYVDCCIRREQSRTRKLAESFLGNLPKGWQVEKVVLMDEPFGALDAQTRNIMQDMLVKIVEHSARTVLFVTHSVDEALYLSDRVVVLSKRPSSIYKIIDVPGDRPRDRTNPEFTELRKRILGYLEEQNVME